NIADVLDLFDKIKVYRADTRNGVYAEVTAAATRLELSDRKTLYEYKETVAKGKWYKAAFYNSATDITGAQSDPMQATAPAFAYVLSVEELRQKYLFGVNLLDDDA